MNKRIVAYLAACLYFGSFGSTRAGNRVGTVLEGVVFAPQTGTEAGSNSSGLPTSHEALVARLIDASESSDSQYQDLYPLVQMDPDLVNSAILNSWKSLKNASIKVFLLQHAINLTTGTAPHLLEIVDLAIDDPDAMVRDSANSLAEGIALQRFRGRPEAYREWRKTTVGKTMADVVATSCRQFVDTLRNATPQEQERLLVVVQHVSFQNGWNLTDGPGGGPEVVARGITGVRRTAAEDAGYLALLGALLQHSASEILRDQALVEFMRFLPEDDQIKPFELELRRRVPAKLVAEQEEERLITINFLACAGRRWAADLLINRFTSGDVSRKDALALINGLAATHDKRAIPYLIAAVDQSRLSDSINLALQQLTGVPAFKNGHDKHWWLDWWVINKRDLPPEVQKIKIPTS